MGAQPGGFPSHGVIIVAWTLTALATLLTFGRFYIHHLKGKRFIWDDVLNGLALVSLITFTAVYQIYGPRKYKVELSQSTLKPHAVLANEIKFRRYNDAAIMLFWCSIYFVKLSFLALYWTLFGLSRRFRIAWWVLAVFIVGSFLASLVWRISLMCPTDQWARRCHAKSQIDMQIGWAVLDVTGDVALMALPLSMLRSLRMRRSQKIGLGVIFSLVLVNMVLEAIRVVLVVAVDLQKFRGYSVLCYFLQATHAVITCTLPCYRCLLIKKKKVGANWTLPVIVMSLDDGERGEKKEEGDGDSER